MIPASVTIKMRRERAGLLQKELADLLGVSETTVIRWEGGKNLPTEKHRGMLAKALGGNPTDYSAATDGVSPEVLRERARLERANRKIATLEAGLTAALNALEAGGHDDLAETLRRLEQLSSEPGD